MGRGKRAVARVPKPTAVMLYGCVGDKLVAHASWSCPFPPSMELQGHVVHFIYYLLDYPPLSLLSALPQLPIFLQLDPLIDLFDCPVEQLTLPE